MSRPRLYVYSCEDILVDERMSFLDDFVQMQLTAGARPYLAPAQRPDFSGELQLGTRFSPSQRRATLTHISPSPPDIGRCRAEEGRQKEAAQV